jgi:hypothetical protein
MRQERIWNVAVLLGRGSGLHLAAARVNFERTPTQSALEGQAPGDRSIRSAGTRPGYSFGYRKGG